MQITKRIIFISSLLLYAIPFIYAQTPKIDSLKTALNNAIEDTNRVNINNLLCAEFQPINPTTALKYGKSALEIADDIGFFKGLAAAENNIGLAYSGMNDYNNALDFYMKAVRHFFDIGYKKGAAIANANIGNLFFAQGNFPKTIEYFFNALRLSQETGDNQRTAQLLGNIGISYYYLGSYPKALDFYLQSLKIRENIGDKQGIAYALSNIGMIYDDQRSFSKSLEYYKRALQIMEETADRKGIAATLNNIGIVYKNTEKFDKAIDYFRQSFRISEKYNIKTSIASSLTNIGDLYKDQGNYKSAIEYYLKTEKIYNELGDKKGIANTLKNMGDMSKIKNDFSKALDFYYQSLTISTTISSKELTKELYQNIAETLEKTGDIKRAFYFEKLYSQLKDSIYTEENIRQMADMQIKYETEKKEKEIKLLTKESELHNISLNRNNIILYSAIGGMILLIVTSVFIFISFRQRQRVKQLNIEIALKESEAKYHDLANLLPQIVFELDENGNIIFINTAGLMHTGYTQENINNNLHISQVFIKENGDSTTQQIQRILKGEKISGQEYIAVKADGIQFPVITYYSSVIKKNKIEGLRGIAIDITEQKQLERKILSKIIETEERERKRFAKDLHDGLGPLLSTIKLYVNDLQAEDTHESEKPKLQKLTNELIDEAVSSTRTIANNLMPGIIMDYGLVKALQSFCDKLNITKAITITFQAPDENIMLEKTTELILYRVVLELINNTIKHAKAKNSIITLTQKLKIINLKYHDNGCGFDVNFALNNPSCGLGLNNIIHRVRSINGICDIKSSAEKGTEINISINL